LEQLTFWLTQKLNWLYNILHTTQTGANKMTARFEAVFLAGEYAERMDSWDVVEWISTHPNGARHGKTVKSFYEWYGEEEAKELAAVLQEEYNRSFYNELG
jgi:GH35 family endo-1,4-beta-xylanase